MMVVAKPAPDLAGRVEKFWLSTSQPGCSGKSIFEILPDGNTDLILRFGGTGSRAFLFGPATVKSYVEIDCSCHYFCIRFRPGQACRVADVDPQDLVDTYMELPNVLTVAADSLGDRLHALGALDPCKQLLENLLRKADRPLVRDQRCRWGAALLETYRGQLQISELANELNIHVRSLERLFLRNFGMSPKRFARVIRLQHILAHMRAGSPRNLADLAYTCGYADQAHMSREFKELTGRLVSEPDSFAPRSVAGTPTGIVHFI